MNIFPQQIITNSEFVNLNQGYNYGYDNSFGTIAEDLLPFNQSVIEAKNSMNAESGLTCNNFPSAPRKRSRDSMNELNRVIVPQQHSHVYELEQNFPIHMQKQQLEIDQIIAQHTKKIRMEIEERQKQQARILVSAIGERVMKKLREKDDEIHKIAKLNHALQDRLKNLFVENQLWKDLAQTNEATVMSLRCNLEQVLTHVSDERQLVVPPNVEEEAESCCGSSGGDDEEEVSARRRVGGKMCRKCGERESCVLLLPCRHLCLCTVCGTTSQSTCPVCNSSMTATVHVNLSH